MTIFEIVFINGKIVAFEADEVEYEDGVYTFYFEGETVAEFKRDNIAGYVRAERKEDEEEE